MTTVNRTLAKLDAASMTFSSPDARRVIRDEANTLRAKLQHHKHRESLLAELASVRHPDSNQGQAQIADIERGLRDCPAVDLAAAQADAERVLNLWQGY